MRILILLIISSFFFFIKTRNLNLLTKKIGTNSAYLSKVINNIKIIFFTQYLNDLRIEYTIN